jgi:hypothetical protein
MLKKNIDIYKKHFKTTYGFATIVDNAMNPDMLPGVSALLSKLSYKKLIIDSPVSRQNLLAKHRNTVPNLGNSIKCIDSLPWCS